LLQKKAQSGITGPLFQGGYMFALRLLLAFTFITLPVLADEKPIAIKGIDVFLKYEAKTKAGKEAFAQLRANSEKPGAKQRMEAIGKLIQMERTDTLKVVKSKKGKEVVTLDNGKMVENWAVKYYLPMNDEIEAARAEAFMKSALIGLPQPTDKKVGPDAETVVRGLMIALDEEPKALTSELRSCFAGKLITEQQK
jgi:hypothetical protein